ncbi:MAG: hypothetical protein Q8O67_34275 [Deltaproteobacteria bacterium]|nr:hypothetical protein [Deltaproteobacteria bacterium]
MAAAGLLGMGLGAFVRVSPAAAAAGIGVWCALIGLVANVDATVGLQVLAGLPILVRAPLFAACAATATVPLGAIIAGLTRRSASPGGVYAADLLGAATGLVAGAALPSVIGVGSLVGAGAIAAALSSALVRNAQAAPSTSPFDSGPLRAVVVLAGAVGLIEVALPRAIASATAATAWPLAAVMAGALLGGAFGARIATPRSSELARAVAPWCWIVALGGLWAVSQGVLLVLGAVDVDASVRLLAAAGMVGLLPFIVALPSGVVLAEALTRDPRRALASSALAAGGAAIATGLALDVARPEHLMALGALAVAGGVARTWPTRAAAVVVVVVVAAVAPRPAPTTDLSRMLLEPAFSAGEPVIALDDSDRSGRVVVGVDDDLVLYRDGKPDASLLGDADTQTLLGVLASLYVDRPRQVLVVGLGVGTTARTFVDVGARDVTVVDVSRAVIDGFAGELPPQIHVVQDDMRAFLVQAAPDSYDVISAEPTNLFVSGVPRAVTREALIAGQRALRPGGVLVLWTHGYLANQRMLDTLVRTTRSVFGRVDTYLTRTNDVVLVATDAPVLPDARRLSRIAGGHLPCILAVLGHADAADLMRRKVEWPTAAGPLHRDAWPVLEADALRALLERSMVSLPPAPATRSAKEIIVDGSGGDLLIAAVTERALIAGQLSALEVTELLQRPEGRAILRGDAAQTRMEIDPLDPPWAPALARAGLGALLGGAGDVDDAVKALGLLSERCAGARTWDLAIHVAQSTARQRPAHAGRIAAALLSPSLPRAREASRATAAEEACGAATDRASCCLEVNQRLEALGRVARGACRR